jgi:predicted ATPase/DNA-binding winged helix-turn-helix (wHTH) protein
MAVTARLDSEDTERTFRLGGLLIDPGTNAIGEARVDAKAMDVLVALAEAAPRVLSSAALLEKVWPTVVVGDNVIHQAIAHLRKALGDSARNPQFIEHVPRRGYRLIASVERRAGSPFPAAEPPHNLPAPLTSFVGRNDEAAEVGELLDRHRLVTLVGPGGVGKSRLAVVIALDAHEHHRDGTWLVELASIATTPVVDSVNGVLRVPEVAGKSGEDVLLAAIASKDMLLVLDNCEHVVADCAQLVHRMLQRAPLLRVLATSREVLDVAGEHVWHVSPLASSDAVQLFQERAREVHPGFALDDRNAPAVGEICKRLDGLPLAIELAAARVRALTVEQIVARLHDRFRLLADGRRTALPRQQTLKATLDWSYTLLEEEEQTLLRRLGVFESGFTLEAAEAVAKDDATAPSVIDVLSRLMDKSWLQGESPAGGAARYRLLETVREYALERLVEAGEKESICDRHSEHFSVLAEHLSRALRGTDQRPRLDVFDAEHENFRSALTWSAARDDTQALRLVAHLWRFWMMRGLATTGRHALEEALAHAPQGAEQSAWRASALLGAGWLARFQGDSAAAQRYLKESAELHHTLADTAGEAEALMNLAASELYLGDTDEARLVATHALDLARRSNDPYVASYCMQTFGDLCASLGDYESGRSLLNEGVALLRTLGHEQSLAFALAKLGSLLLNQGELSLARPALEEAHALHQRLGEGLGIDHTLLRLGWLAHHEGNDEEAKQLLERSLAIAEQAGFVPEAAMATSMLGMLALDGGEIDRAAELLECGLREAVAVRAHDVCASCLEGLAIVVKERGDPSRAAELVGAASALRRATLRPLHHVERNRYERALRALRSAMGKAAFERARGKGKRVSVQQAVELAAR